MRYKSQENAVFIAIHPATCRGGGFLTHGVLKGRSLLRLPFVFSIYHICFQESNSFFRPLPIFPFALFVDLCYSFFTGILRARRPTLLFGGIFTLLLLRKEGCLCILHTLILFRLEYSFAPL